MIVGVGLDVVEVARIERAMQNPRFLRRVLTGPEREFCHSPQQVAGRWAAKEAIAKALGTPLTWQSVEVLSESTGKPVAVMGDLPAGLTLHLSISHERGLAAAVAIAERGT
ncbi:MAG TPA: holo-ACP synthase [Fimbriimonadaceae bacterium]|nr:holo-ACP synthase [Fimbriimonadaceae bacterium]